MVVYSSMPQKKHEPTDNKMSRQEFPLSLPNHFLFCWLFPLTKSTLLAFFLKEQIPPDPYTFKE